MSERHWQRPALASTALALLGAVTIVGPDASQASAKKLASQAYAHARQSLS